MLGTKTRLWFVSVASFCTVGWHLPADAAEPVEGPARPLVGLTQIPHLKLEPQAELAEEKRDEIARLIWALDDLETPQEGLLGSDPFGHRFLPIGSFNGFGEREIERKKEPFPPFLKLVQLGPKALPQLLEHLDRETRTKLVIRAEEPQGTVFIRLWFDDALMGNPANPLEQKILGLGNSPWQHRREGEDQLESYRVKVGDVCLAAIGQIVARDYEVLSYNHIKDLSVVICSPAHSVKLRNNVRAIWTAENATQRVFDSLLIDYSTRGIDNGVSLDEWGVGNDIQVKAILRLLYYFPKVTAPMIAERLMALDVSEAEDFAEQCVKNGIRANEFVDAVGWSQEPAIRKAISHLAERAKDREVIRALRRAGAKVSEP